MQAQSDPQYWQRQSIYQIVTDRFFDGDPSNNNAEGTYDPAGSSGTSVHGGDFKGVQQKLDYIQSLGATAIWISPIVLNANGEFHGYAGRNFYAVAPHWGSLTDLKNLTSAAHTRGMAVILDIVVNHGGDLIYSTDSGYDTFRYPPAGYNLIYRGSKQYSAPFNTNAANPSLTNLFHNNGAIQTYTNSIEVELGELSGLDDFRTESPYIRSNMVAVYAYWIGQAGFDGFRIDTVKHVEMGCWHYWCPLLHAYAATNGLPNFFMFGEVYDGSDAKCGSYTGTQAGGAFALDSVLDYPLYFLVNGVFANATAPTQQIESRYAALAGNYDPSAQNRLVTFLDNHDQARFLSSGNANNNTNRLEVALVFLYSSRGVPSLYYGTEQAFNGTTDPNDREDMFDGQFEQGPSLGDNFNIAHPLFQWVARLNNFRRLYPALQTGLHTNMWSNSSGPGLLAYSRRLNSQEVLVILNTAGSSQTLSGRPTIYTAGTTLVNLLDTNETVVVQAGPQTPSITLAGTSAKMFIAQSQLLPLDPVVTSVTPAHDSTNVTTVRPVILQFSKPMDTGSVASAFSTVPSVSGTFAWSPSNDVMTFSPAGAGFPTQTLVTVRLAATARDAISSNTFYAAFESRFKTGTNTFIDGIRPTVLISSPGNGSALSGVVQISGTATDNVAVQKVELRMDAGLWTTVSGTNTWSYNLNSSNFLNGPHVLSARATDTSSNISPTNSINLSIVNVPGSYLQRISGGNPANVTDCSANVWLRDQGYTLGSFGYSGGATGYLNHSITGICASAQSLYQRERFSNSTNGFLYLFDCPAGVYEITMLESETYWTGPGQRVFNAFIQSRQVLTNFDIFVAAGGMNLPLTRVFTNSITNSQLQILFTPVVDNARISGIQARKIADAYSDTDGIPDWWRLAYFGHALGQASDLSRASDDPDGDGMSNLAEYLAGTNPLDAASVLKLTGVISAGSNLLLSWYAVTNKIYQVQSAAVLGNPAAWSNLGTAITGANQIVTQTVASAGIVSQFYRVEAK